LDEPVLIMPLEIFAAEDYFTPKMNK